MTFKEDLITARDAIVGTAFSVSGTTSVPETQRVGYDEAKSVNATYLYADMVDSSGLVAVAPRETVGKVIRTYLDLSVRIIRKHDGHIRSFDGDRVMGIFMGDGRHDRAVKAAMQVKWACEVLIQPKLQERYASVRNSGWVLKPGCGIANGDALIVRGGVRRSSSDLVSVGIVPNLAAKLSDVRDGKYHLRIGAGTYKGLSESCRLSKGVEMWEGTYQLKMGGNSYRYYRTSYRWSI